MRCRPGKYLSLLYSINLMTLITVGLYYNLLDDGHIIVYDIQNHVQY